LQYNSLGLRYFSRYVVTFDFPDACLYLRQGAHHARPEPGATSGLTLKWESAAPVVDAVRTDGPAARAGLARFDVLVGIDGKEAAEFDHFSLRELLTSEAGRRVKLRVRRGERELDFIVLLAED
jgi:S1-C subfamily serine protease